MATGIVDAYGHAGLPRFVSADQYMAMMDAQGVEQAMVCTAETCPDLREVTRAIVEHGDRFRGAGIPIGKTPEEMVGAITAQMEAGFLGIRLADGLIVEYPQVLDAIGALGGIPFVVGSKGLQSAAGHLTAFLKKYPKLVVCGAHFAGGGDPDLLTTDPVLAALYANPRFLVIFSRQGAYKQEELVPWAKAVVQRVGWGRVMFGSEFPVLLWRDETYAAAGAWIDTAGLNPTGNDRANYFGVNATRYLFSRPVRAAQMLNSRWAWVELKKSAPVWLSPDGSARIDQKLNRAIMDDYLKRDPGGKGKYSAHVAKMIAYMLQKDKQR